MMHQDRNLGVEGLRLGLIDDIGTKTAAIAKAATLANIRNYGVVELFLPRPSSFRVFSTSDLDALKSRTGLIPIYYYLYFESE